jgi:hypothetical protein
VAEIARAWLNTDAGSPPGEPAPPSASPSAADVTPPPAARRAPPREPAAPAAPAAPEAREGEEAPRVRGAGELWVNAAVPLGGGEAGAAVRRAAVGFAVAHPVVTGRLLVAGETVGAEPAVRLDDAWLRVQTRGSVRGWARFGVARPAFGVSDRFEEERHYWVAGRSAELERQSGWLPSASAGLAAGVAGARWEASAELADAAAAAPAPTFDAVEARGRASLGVGGTEEAPLARLGVSAAFRSPLAGEQSERLLGAVHAEVAAGRFRLFAEGLVGSDGPEATPLVGGLAAAAAEVPVATGPVRAVGVVLAGGGWDPALSGLPENEDVPDAWYEGRAGLNVHWRVRESSFLTGVGYLLDVPQDLALPVTQTFVVEAAWRY